MATFDETLLQLRETQDCVQELQRKEFDVYKSLENNITNFLKSSGNAMRKLDPNIRGLFFDNYVGLVFDDNIQLLSKSQDIQEVAVKLALLDSVIIDEIAAIDACTGKDARLHYIPYWNTEHDTYPGIALEEVTLDGIKTKNRYSRENATSVYLAYHKTDCQSESNLIHLLQAKTERDILLQSGVFKIEVVGEDIVFPTPRLQTSMTDLDTVLKRYFKSLR